MILFYNDWARFPTAIAHLSTKNRSWVRLASVYKSMGVKNHMFLLALVNPALEGIDPHSPHLTLEQMAAIAVECKVNPWYFFREVARAPAIGGDESTMVEANRGNIALWWSFFNHIMIILIQIRQTGKSFSTDILMSLLMNVVCQNTKINLLTKDDSLRRKNVERLKEIMEDLPRYLQMRTKDDTHNTEEITVRTLNNFYSTHVPQASEKRAYNMGRGLTSAIFHIDEAPFQPNIAVALPAALAATGAAVEKAKAAGTPWGTIITTTAGKKDDKDGRFVFNLLQDAATWSERFFDALDWNDLYRMVTKASMGGVFRVNATFSHRQLGKSDEWLKEKLDQSLQKGEDANRDYFNLWTSGSESSPLSADILDKIAASKMEPPFVEITRPNAYVLNWYIPEEQIESRMASGRFVMGMDTSEASGGDDISLILVDVATLEVVAAGKFNETNLLTFAEWVCSLFVRWDTFVAVIERRSTGGMLLDVLLRQLPALGIDPFKRLYNTVVQDYDEEPEVYKEIRQPMGRRDSNIYVRHKRSFGFATSGSGATSRSDLYGSTLQLAAKRACDRVFDDRLIHQILGLVVKNGRVDHERGEHDDMIIGWLLCMWFLTMGKNLAHYDIDVKQVMSYLNVKKIETQEEYRRRLEQDQLRRDIQELYEKLINEEDDYVAQRYEQRLRLLDKQIELEQGEHYSLDGLLTQVREAKRSRVQKAARGMTGNPYERMMAGTPIAAHNIHHGSFSDSPMGIRDFYR